MRILTQEQVLRVLRVWEVWSLFPPLFVRRLEDALLKEKKSEPVASKPAVEQGGDANQQEGEV